MPTRNGAAARTTSLSPLFEEAVAAGRSIIYGATSTGGHIPHFFAKLKENEYQILLLLCSSSDEFRRQAVQYRNQEVRFYQLLPKMSSPKASFFLSAWTPILPTPTSCISIGAATYPPERLAAIYRNGKLEILDDDAMNLFIQSTKQTAAPSLPKAKPFHPSQPTSPRKFKKHLDLYKTAPTMKFHEGAKIFSHSPFFFSSRLFYFFPF